MRRVIAFVAASAFVASPAWSAAVILVHPSASDPFIEEIFHRVTGELRVHAISIKQEEGVLPDTSQPTAQDLLQRTQADACVFFTWRGETSVVSVWVNGSASAPALFEAVALERTPDVPTMLAARAVDLLTAALRPKNAADSVPAPRSTDLPSTAVTATLAEERSERPWFVEALAGTLVDLSTFGPAVGPQVVVGKTLSERFRLGAWVAGPLFGARHANAEASVRLVQALGLVQGEAVLAHVRPFTLCALVGAGTYFIRAEGTVSDGVSSISPGRDERWMLASSLGAEGALAVSSHVSLVLTTQALLLLPRPRVAVGRESPPFTEPLLGLALGVRFAF